MRISDWSSDVCSSDLLHEQRQVLVDLRLELNRQGVLGRRHLEADEEGRRHGEDDVVDQRPAEEEQKGRRDEERQERRLLVLVEPRRHEPPELGEKHRKADERSEEHTYELQSLMRNSYA